eukprot:11214246-Lingulodinium_polyedra.AAC.1
MVMFQHVGVVEDTVAGPEFGAQVRRLPASRWNAPVWVCAEAPLKRGRLAKTARMGGALGHTYTSW